MNNKQRRSMGLARELSRAAMIVLLSWGSAHAQTVSVASESELRSAIADANGSGGNVTILIEAGTYSLREGLYITAPGVVIRGKSGHREDVTIQGDAMSSGASVGTLITVAADHFTLEGVTLQRSGNHLIQVRGEKDADFPIIRNCVLRDAYEQILKVSVDLSNTSVSSDNGIVENCLFEYTAGVGPQYYIGGIDAHSSKNWIVRDNVFKNIISPNTSIAEYAIHFWNDSENNLVERNLIIDCDRGIGFGLSSRGNVGGTIRNNMIYHADGRGQFADVGIAIHNSPNSAVYNNTIFMEHDYPNAIELRFGGTSDAFIANNLVNADIRSQDGASGTFSNNIENASRTWFADPAAGNLHLVSPVADVVDSGADVHGLEDDFDEQRRPQGNGVDIGADEYTGVRPNPPEDLTVGR